jgi:hypothetical protein
MRIKLIQTYRQRKRMWTMSVLPTMSEPEWTQFAQWVADFDWQRRTTRRVRRRVGRYTLVRGPSYE